MQSTRQTVITLEISESEAIVLRDHINALMLGSAGVPQLISDYPVLRDLLVCLNTHLPRQD